MDHHNYLSLLYMYLLFFVQQHTYFFDHFSNVFSFFTIIWHLCLCILCIPRCLAFSVWYATFAKFNLLLPQVENGHPWMH